MLTKLGLLAFVIHSKSKFLSHHLLPHRLCNSKKLEYNRELWSEPGQTNTGSGIPSSIITAMLNLYPINSACWIAMQEKIVKWFIYSQISCENLDLTRKPVKEPLGKNKILQNIISSNCVFLLVMHPIILIMKVQVNKKNLTSMSMISSMAKNNEIKSF